MTEEQHRQNSKAAQPEGEGRHRAICCVARRLQPEGDAPSSRLASGPVALPPNLSLILPVPLSSQPAPSSPLRNWVEATVKAWGFAGVTLFLFGLLEWLTERHHGASELTLTLLTLGGRGAPFVVLRGTIDASYFLRKPGIRIISVVFQTGAALVAGLVAIGFLGG